MPKRTRIYCPTCRKHTDHTISVARKKPRGELRKGQRRFRRKVKPTGKTRGARGYPKSKQKREKPTKRLDLRYMCTKCKKSRTRPGIRTKSLELTD